ncbi:MAG: hypothetical protein BWY31_03304 [Lentisphaerae bacterium ADurb.Bin242]|nr:MAG: hypothetical protein BWY31_03304 [Lentisphaerae bacterium ADurb.Bin242]
MKKEEAWIWTELLAFDNTQTDYGVGEYLHRTGFVPDGVSLLLSAIDFVLLHRGMETEYELFPDVCSRLAHEENEERKRQKWTNHQLRGLVCHLRGRGVKIFFSFFVPGHDITFHHEWCMDHPEVLLGSKNYGIIPCAVNMLARLKDGTLFEDFFVAKLVETVCDYGFDGWHGADSQGPLGSLCRNDGSDEFVFQFAEYIGRERFGSEYLEEMDASPEKMSLRLEYIWKNFHTEWADFASKRWVSLWSKATAAMHALGKETMINSPMTKSVFESIFYFGLDYREIAKIGVDYLLVESVSTSISLINGGEERLFDYCAAIAELKAAAPGMKFIMMPGVKDVVESYDSLRHAPARLERDFYMLSNQTILCRNGLRRCADGYMICLGDGITPQEWSFLNNLRKETYSFGPVRSGELVWLLDPAVFDPMREDHRKHGTWPPYLQVSHLVENYALDISCVCTADARKYVKQPLLVPNFDLLDRTLQEELLAEKRIPVFLLGNFHNEKIPARASAVFCRIDDDYTLGCVALNSVAKARKTELPCPEKRRVFDGSDYHKPVENRCPRMDIPESFWKGAAKLIREGIGKSPLENPQDGTLVMSMKNRQSVKRVALISRLHKYAVAKYGLEKDPGTITKISPFPYARLVRKGKYLGCKDAYSPLHVPPMGMMVFEYKDLA